MDRLKKYWPYLIFALVIPGLVVLSSSISRMQLKPGTLFDDETSSELSLLLNQFIAYRGQILFCAALIPIALFLFALSTYPRNQQITTTRRLNPIATLLQLILFVAAFAVIRRKVLENPNNPFSLARLGIDPQEFPADTEITRIQVNTSEFLTIIVGFILLLAAIFFIVWLIQRRPKPAGSINKLAIEAQEALDEIESGADLRNVIMRCYIEMTETVEETRGEKRSQGMTPREFEVRLVNLGIPREPVQQLTKLFENVRYGAREADTESEELAKSSLMAIIQACKEVG
jgi:hypothetical protein